MLEQRYYGSSVTVNGKLWITGGQNELGKHLNSTEFISPGQPMAIKGIVGQKIKKVQAKKTREIK